MVLYYVGDFLRYSMMRNLMCEMNLMDSLYDCMMAAQANAIGLH